MLNPQAEHQKGLACSASGGTRRWVVWFPSDHTRRRAGVVIMGFPGFLGQRILTPGVRWI